METAVAAEAQLAVEEPRGEPVAWWRIKSAASVRFRVAFILEESTLASSRSLFLGGLRCGYNLIGQQGKATTEARRGES